MKKDKVIVSKKDIVIPKGTVFENIDGCTTEYFHNNYVTYIGLGKDDTVFINVSGENEEYFDKED